MLLAVIVAAEPLLLLSAPERGWIFHLGLVMAIIFAGANYFLDQFFVGAYAVEEKWWPRSLFVTFLLLLLVTTLASISLFEAEAMLRLCISTLLAWFGFSILFGSFLFGKNLAFDLPAFFGPFDA